MSLLLIVSLVWAFSFGLIGSSLKGVHPDVVSFIRLTLAAAVFVPFARRIPWTRILQFAGIGAIQFGVMYHAYNWSFQFLKGHEIALLTVTTPFFITALNDLQRRRFAPINAILATLAVLGALIVKAGGTVAQPPLVGVLLIQLSNLAFAFGQLAYRRLYAGAAERTQPGDASVFFYCYAGAALVTAPLASIHLVDTFVRLTRGQLAALLYLGIIASGMSFFLWNRGARHTSAGTLAVMNNLKIPLAVLVSFLVFGEKANLPRLIAGGGLVFAAALLPTRKETWT
ncbi:MAG: EamA family transporter [Lentisphaerae bacterium]|nr:EamA family transporter [Lentisphaerota bacterium]